jgi:D-alanine-D-alanine ligase
MKELGRVGVLMGGPSSEREISLRSGAAIHKSFKEEGLDAIAVDITTDDLNDIENMLQSLGLSAAFIALHGLLGEDGKIQSVLEKLKIPYVGSGVKASNIAIDKIKTQKLLKENGISVPDNFNAKKNDDVDGMIKELLGGYPAVVKPPCEGSSLGISIVSNPGQLQAALNTVWEFTDIALVEKFIAGRELTVGILGNSSLPVIEISSSRGFFDYTAKYQKGFTEYKVPASLEPSVEKRLRDVALDAFVKLGCRHFGRVDMILAADGKEYVLEINTIPGFTETSLLPKAAAYSGINFNQLCMKLLKMAYGEKTKETVTTFTGSV